MYDITYPEYVDVLSAVSRLKYILNAVELDESTFINPDIVTGNNPAKLVVKFEYRNVISETSSACK